MVVKDPLEPPDLAVQVACLLKDFGLIGAELEYLVFERLDVGLLPLTMCAIAVYQRLAGLQAMESILPLSPSHLLSSLEIGGVVLVFGITGRFLWIYHVVKSS